MNKNDAIDALNDFLALAIDALPADAFDLPADTAQAMLDAMPQGELRDSLRDAFRDNIDTDITFN
jgi:hypothetical protein